MDADYEKLADGLGRAIARLRQARDLTQEEVAHAANLSIRHYQQLESGRMLNPKLWTLYRIAGVLELTIVRLLEEAKRKANQLKKRLTAKRAQKV